jgi:uncharacterized damage-inducible protein DinB
MEEVLYGRPWYGKSVNSLLTEIDPALVYEKFNENSHSIIDLLYHMVTWVEFTQQRLEKSTRMNNNDLETLDWRETNVTINTWNNGLSQFNACNNRILEILKHSTDDLLGEKVDYRDYNFEYLLQGVIQQNIYHLGQIANAYKLLSGKELK